MRIRSGGIFHLQDEAPVRPGRTQALLVIGLPGVRAAVFREEDFADGVVVPAGLVAEDRLQAGHQDQRVDVVRDPDRAAA